MTSPQKASILIVDDEPDILESLEVMLSRNGHHILKAQSGYACLNLLKKETPDLILLDIMMPTPNGFEVCERIKNDPQTKNIPVLLLTALNDMESRVQGLDYGADDFISKPFNDVELRARVRAFLRTKQLRDELEESYKKLKELEELRDAMIHTMVHDLKTPLTSIKTGTSIVLDHLDSGENLTDDHKKLLQNSHRSSQRILNLVQDILDVSRMEENKLPVHKTRVDIGKLVASSLEALTPLIRQAGVSIHFKSPTPPVLTELDEDLIQRVIINLISNSLKFTEQTGSITVAVTRDPEKNQWECVIRDTGIGIPKENLNRIFDKFFQGNTPGSSRRGQGLGLAFCRMAIEAHGGEIWVESDEGQGSCFIIRTPLS